jgi:NitT/TauT family transport system substrate-binding protein
MNPMNRWTRRQAMSLLAGFSGSLMLNACTQSGSNSAPTSSNASKTPSSAINTSNTSSGPFKMSLGLVVGWVGYSPLYIALEKGFFKELGLNFSLQTFGSNTEARAAFASGAIDGQAVVTTETILQAQTGKDYKIVLYTDNSLGGDGILARKSIATIQDFKGQTIAVEVGGVDHFFLLQVLKEAGLSSRDVKLINTSPDAAAAAYGAGKVNVAVAYEPFLSQANAAQPDGRIIYDSSRMPSAIADFYIFDSQYIATYPKAITAFVQGIFKGTDFLKTNPQESYAIAAKPMGITPKELQEQLKGVRIVDLPMNKEMLGNPNSKDYVLNTLKEAAIFLKEQGQIKETPDMAKYIDSSFINALS